MSTGPILNRRSRTIPPPQWHTFSPPLTCRAPGLGGGLPQGLGHRQRSPGDPGRARQRPQGPHCHSVLQSTGASARLVAGRSRAGCDVAGRLAVSGPEPGQPPEHAPAEPHLSRRQGGRRDRQAGQLAHAAALLCHPLAGAEGRYSGDPGSARPCQAQHHRPRQPSRRQDPQGGQEPAGAT